MSTSCILPYVPSICSCALRRIEAISWSRARLITLLCFACWGQRFRKEGLYWHWIYWALRELRLQWVMIHPFIWGFRNWVHHRRGITRLHEVSSLSLSMQHLFSKDFYIDASRLLRIHPRPRPQHHRLTSRQDQRRTILWKRDRHSRSTWIWDPKRALVESSEHLQAPVDHPGVEYRCYRLRLVHRNANESWIGVAALSYATLMKRQQCIWSMFLSWSRTGSSGYIWRMYYLKRNHSVHFSVVTVIILFMTKRYCP